MTGNIVTPEQHPGLPVTPAQIADAALEAAEAGAAAAHIHVRDPETGRPSMSLDYYADVIDRIRAKHRSLIINLTTGPGGRFVPDEDEPRVAAPGTTLLHPLKRVEHIAALRPDVCSLDLNTMNSGGDVVINTPANVRKMAGVIRSAGVMPELEIFDSGDLNMALDFMREGVLDGPGLWTFVLGVKYGFAPSPETIFYARSMLPQGAHWSAFGIGRAEFPIVAQAWLAGGHVRVGLEDNIYLEKGVLAPNNAALVAKARDIVKSLGGDIASSSEARTVLGLRNA
ncbi:3-keto-5-aminohexanoate cleavage enzyme [compost metagenome]